MMLSEAIRLGAMLREQCRLRMFYKEKSCALGAALEAVGLRPLALQVGFYDCTRKDLLGIEEDLVTDIMLRNDRQYMTREAISDWLLESGRDVEIPGTSVPVEQRQEVEVTP